MAAGELAALGISISLRELHAKAGTEAGALVREWLGCLEGAKPALSEHRYHPQFSCTPAPATWHPPLACRQCYPALCGDLVAQDEL